MHPYYDRALGMIGQPVCVHAYGELHYGILHQVTYDGVYLRKTSATGAASFNKNSAALQLVPNTTKDTSDTEPVFFWLWPLFFLPWLAIAALTPWWLW